MSNHKKILHTAAAVSLAFSLAFPAGSLAAPAKTPNNGGNVDPIRETALKLGAEVKWDQSKQTITIKKYGYVLALKIGEKAAVLNGKKVSLNHRVQLMGGQSFVDSGFVANVLAEAKQQADPADVFLEELQAGHGTEAAKYISESSAYAFPVDLLNRLWGSNEDGTGLAMTYTSKHEITNAVHRNVTYSFLSAPVPFDFTIRLNPAGKIDDLYIAEVAASTYQKPTYDNSAAYTEREVTVGEGPMALPGTLTVPVGEGPFPAVVLVHGSGASDRDESIGAAKPFRDLAAGLAAQGIAVLRYDKITYEHMFKVVADTKFTLKRETVDDAISAVKLLKNTKNIDPSRIYVAGHSQGGFAMPLITDADKEHGIAGTILLSGPSGKFADLLIEQQTELINRMKKLGMDTAPYEQQAEMWTSLATAINDPQYSVDHMPDQFPLQPAYWYFEQKNYVPTDLAKKQTGPMLVLQGENDWQVPMKEFEGWKSALKDRKDVVFKSYPKMNHLLTEYDEVSIGAEYTQPSNVSKTIIDDISDWVKKAK